MSWTARALVSRPAQYLGKLSYSLYLVHWPLIQYICLFVYGTAAQPMCTCKRNYHCDEICYAVQFQVRINGSWASTSYRPALAPTTHQRTSNASTLKRQPLQLPQPSSPN